MFLQFILIDRNDVIFYRCHIGESKLAISHFNSLIPSCLNNLFLLVKEYLHFSRFNDLVFSSMNQGKCPFSLVGQSNLFEHC